MNLDKRSTFDIGYIFSQSTAKRCYQLSDQDIEALLNIYPQALWSKRWQNREGYSDDTITAYFGDLSYRLLNPDDCKTCEEGDCISYPPDASFISYFPVNPYLEPDTVPSGYLTPPFKEWKEINTWLPDFIDDWLTNAIGNVTHYRVGDMLVDLSSLPLLASWQQLINGFLPEIKIEFSGIGVLELHMLTFPLGGRAIITVDNKPNIIDIFSQIWTENETIIELNRDLFAVPPEFNEVVIHELTFDVDEPHTVYVTFLPTVDDSSIPVNFGGGLRRVVTCGLDVNIMPIVQDVRLNNCVLEVLVNDVWIPKESVNDCVTAITDPIVTQLNQNTQDISDNSDILTQLTTVDIPQINLSLQSHSDILTQLTTIDIPQINLTLIDLASRINNLEVNVGSGNIILNKNTQSHTYLGQVSAAPIIQFEDVDINAEIDLEVTDSGLTHVIFTANIVKVGTANNRNVQLRVGNGTVWSDSVMVYSDGTPQLGQTVTVVGVFEDLPSGVHTFKLQWFSSAIEVRLVGILTMSAIHIGRGYPDTLELIDPVVTFDENTAPYTIPVSADQVGVISTGGNPDNCLFAQGVTDTKYLEIEIDLGVSKQVEGVYIDHNIEQPSQSFLEIFLDDISMNIVSMYGDPYTWYTVQYFPLQFPQMAQLVRVRVSVGTGHVQDNIRIDNIFIDTGGI